LQVAPPFGLAGAKQGVIRHAGALRQNPLKPLIRPRHSMIEPLGRLHACARYRVHGTTKRPDLV
jgi:hypothetical protein